MNNQSKPPLVVLFGRPNVGKSTLFNCLLEKNQALVSKTPGTTRDANFGTVHWQGKFFNLIDTGGILNVSSLKKSKAKKGGQVTKDIDAIVQKKAREYILRADLILFLVDSRTGLLPADKEMSLILKKIVDKKKVMPIANKADSPSLRQQTAEFNKLGFGEPIAISAVNSSGTGDMLDSILKKIKASTQADSEPEQKQINISIIGKPNVGKSSLINAFLGEDRLIVSETPHTTREPQDIVFNSREYDLRLIDTAGISRQGRKLLRHAKLKDLEKFSIAKSLATLKKADIALLMIDINNELTHQEAKLVEEIIKQRVSLIIVANKWDLIKTKDTKEYKNLIYSRLPFATWAPIHFVSALTGSKIKTLPDLIIDIYHHRQISISPNSLTKFLNSIVKKHRPTRAKGTKNPRIWELKQTKIAPPVFSARIGSKDSLSSAYVNFIANRLRDKYKFYGTPISINVVKNAKIHSKPY